jgi:hypothetical protein
MPLAVNDIVRVTRQPKDMLSHILGEVGYITEIQDLGERGVWANIQTMRPDGRRGGGGGVPLDCLALEPGADWKRARELIEAEYARDLEECLARGRRWETLVAQVATKHGISPETAEAIHQELGAFFP